MRKTIILLIVGIIILSGCTKKKDINVGDMISGAVKLNADSVNYLALGDSYTVGQSVSLDQSYPYQLALRLQTHGYKIDKPTIIANTGWTTDALITGIANSTAGKKRYSFVTLLIGVNDQYYHLSQDNYKIKFTQVINSAISFAHGDSSKVFVLSIPDWGVTPFGKGKDSIIGPQIDEFNAINKAISTMAGVNYVDITEITKQAAINPELISSDGLHPSGEMYQQWINLLAPMVSSRLK